MGLMDSGRRLVAATLLLAAALAAPAPVCAALTLDPAQQPVGLRDAGQAWTDASGAVPVETVATDRDIQWVATRDDAIYKLETGKALWIRFTLPPASDSERWYLQIPYPSVDLVTLYMQDDDGRWQVQPAAGDTLPVASWPLPHRHPLLPVLVAPREARPYLLSIRNPHSYSAPLSFINASYLSLSEQRTSLVLGIYFGLAGLAAILGVLSALSLRDTAYALYAQSVALMGLAQAAMTGIGGLHLWPNLPWWNDRSPMVLPVLAVGSLIWFFSSVVSLRERSLVLHRLVTGLALLALVTALGILFIAPSNRMFLMVPYIVIAAHVAIGAIIWTARRGDRYALWLLVATVPVMIGAVFPTARVMGLIPVSFWTMYGMQIGIAIELPVLLVILMMRSQQRREHHRRIQGLERMDPSTGLMNGQVFTERLTRMVARSQRLKYQSAVVLIDLVNTEQIRRDFGGPAAEELPLRVAGRLLSAARDIDEVARLSDLRFGMLVEGPLTPEEAATVGPRVVARCLMPFKNKPLEWVARVRVAQSLLPAERDVSQIVERMEALLAAVPADSKRAVFALRG